MADKAVDSPNFRHPNAVNLVSAIRDYTAEFDERRTNLLNSEVILTYSGTWLHAPKLPGAQYLMSENMLWSSLPFSNSSPERVVTDTIGVARAHVMRFFEPEKYKPGKTSETDFIYANLATKLAGGNIIVIAANIARISKKQDLPLANLFVPNLCLRALYDTQVHMVAELAEKEQFNSQASAINMVRAGVYDRLQNACKAIRSGTRIKHKGTSPHSLTEASAIRALQHCYATGDSEDFKSNALDILVPVYAFNFYGLRATMLGPEEVRLAAKELAAFGLPISEALIQRKLVHMASAETRMHKYKASPLLFANDLNMLHSQLLMRHYTRSLVDGIANGSINYIDIAYLEAISSNKPLATRAQEVARIHDEERRRREAVFLESLKGFQAEFKKLGWTPLPIGKGTLGPRNTPHQKTGEHTEEVGLDDFRLAIMASIKAMWPGSEVYYRQLRSGKGEKSQPEKDQPVEETETKEQSKPGDTTDAKDTNKKNKKKEHEEYIILVLPRTITINGEEHLVFDCWGDCRKPDNAGYAWRAETGISIYPSGKVKIVGWEEVFSKDRPHARSLGAITFIHPTAEQMSEDPELAAGLFRNLVLEFLTAEVAFGKTPEDIRRSIGRGTIASIAARRT